MSKCLDFLENTHETRYRYRTATKKERGEILRMFCELTGCSRRHARRVLRGKFKPKENPKRRGRRSHYGYEEFLTALKKLWLATDQMCGTNLKVAIPIWLPFYEEQYGVLGERVRQDLLGISAPTINRLLQPFRVEYPKRRSCTRPGTLLRQQIPIRTTFWNVDRPGYIEADTVHHCGESTSGVYVCSLTMTDIYSEWTENQAIWGRNGSETKIGVEAIERKLPFEILGFDCDNGGEFLNLELVRYFLGREKVVPFTRSREYRSNDNAHVEQKNWTHVRQLLGYDRFDDQAFVVLLNDLYVSWNDYRNFFCPTMKLKEKLRDGGKTRRRYEISHTPYQRLIASEHISEEKKNDLRERFRSLNPFTLRNEIEQKLRAIFRHLRNSRLQGDIIVERA